MKNNEEKDGFRGVLGRSRQKKAETKNLGSGEPRNVQKKPSGRYRGRPIPRRKDGSIWLVFWHLPAWRKTLSSQSLPG